jgi:hypothetical protein
MTHYNSEADALDRLDELVAALNNNEFGYIGDELIVYQKQVQRKGLDPRTTFIEIKISQFEKYPPS